MPSRVTIGPVSYEGIVMRTVDEGGWVYSEAWTGSEWVRGGTVANVMQGRALSPDELDELGILAAASDQGARADDLSEPSITPADVVSSGSAKGD
jgi:hypothetical protein